MTNRLVLVASGFLLAVLWMDLKFDSLLLPHLGDEGPASQETLDAIVAYYKRALFAERNSGFLIAFVMVVGGVACVIQATRGGLPKRWLRIVLPALYLPPPIIAITRIIPQARRLGNEAMPLAEQSAIAHEILYAHAYCLVSIALSIVMQLWVGRMQTERAS